MEICVVSNDTSIGLILLFLFVKSKTSDLGNKEKTKTMLLQHVWGYQPVHTHILSSVKFILH